MAEFTKSYKAKGVLSNVDQNLTETKKEGVFTHDFAAAFKEFEGEEVVISITRKEEVTPVDAEATGE